MSDLAVGVSLREGPDADVYGSQALTVNGKKSVFVFPGVSFATDPVELEVKQSEYVVLSMTVRGGRVPCHPENLIPTYQKTPDGLIASKQVYLPSSVGADFPVYARVGFIGDSITQGIGCPENSYLHYSAVCARRLSALFDQPLSFWNLGIGCGRGADFAQNGSWAAKAKHCDIVTFCFGVNDLSHIPGDAEVHLNNLLEGIRILKDAGCRIVLQTVPPFDMPPERERIRRRINDLLIGTCGDRVDLLFDENVFLSSRDDPHKAIYGGHPDPRGCAIWGEKLANAMLPLLSGLKDRDRKK